MLPKSITIYKELYEYMGSLEFSINRSYTINVYTRDITYITLLGDADIVEYYSLIICNSIEEKLHAFGCALRATYYNQIRNDIRNRT